MSDDAPDYELIDTDARFSAALEKIAECDTFFLDTEFDSSHRGTRLCLVQIACSAGIFLVDPLRLASLEKLSASLGGKDATWVIHAGSQDIPLLEEALGVRAPARLFDTQVAWSLLTAESSVGLSYLKYKVLGVRSSKAHQTDDWTRRPLHLPLLDYAASDVADLPELHRRLLEAAEKRGRVEAIYEASHETLTQRPEPAPPLTLKSFRNAWLLEAKSQAALSFLIDFSNALSRADRELLPEPKVLLAIAARTPESPDVLSRLKGVPRPFVDRFGKEVTAGIRKAKEESTSLAFVPLEPPPYTTFADERLDAWFGLLRAEVCARLRVAPDFVLPMRVVKSLRKSFEEGGVDSLIGSLQGFRRSLLSEAIARFANSAPPPDTEDSSETFS